MNKAILCYDHETPITGAGTGFVLLLSFLLSELERLRSRLLELEDFWLETLELRSQLKLLKEEAEEDDELHWPVS